MTEELNSNKNSTKIWFSLRNLQKSTNQLIAPKKLHIWRKYLNEIFTDIKPSINLDEITIMSTHSDFDYLQKVTKLISNTPKAVLNFYIWSDIVIELWTLYQNEAKMHELGANTCSATCMLKAVGSMPMAATYATIEPNFFEETKPKIEIIINNIRVAFKESIEQLDWIDSKTKELILEKGNAMKIFIGSPDEVLDADKLDDFYADLSFNETSHVDNLMHFQQWEINRKLKTFHLADDVDWTRNPTVVNAYQFREYNKISMYFYEIISELHSTFIFCFLPSILISL